MPYTIEDFIHYPHVIPDVTESRDGLMSAADKVKLDNLVGGGGYATVENGAATLPRRTILNFDGVQIVASDDVPNSRTNVTVVATLADIYGNGAVAADSTLIITEEGALQIIDPNDLGGPYIVVSDMPFIDGGQLYFYVNSTDFGAVLDADIGTSSSSDHYTLRLWSDTQATAPAPVQASPLLSLGGSAWDPAGGGSSTGAQVLLQCLPISETPVNGELRFICNPVGTTVVLPFTAGGTIPVVQGTGTTVGAAGAASALPGPPLGYLTVALPGGATVVVPYYNHP